MLPLDNRSRKRSLRDLNYLPNDIESRRGSTNRAIGNESLAPVICLTGLAPEEKDDYHRIIERLGGRFTRNLDSSVNTHLVAQSPEGLKYEAALSIPSIEVVSPGWLDTCSKEGRWVFTKDYLLDASAPMVEEELPPSNGTLEKSFHLDLDRVLVENPEDTNTTLFGDCRVFLVGFEDDIQAKLSRLLRRGMATISWDLDDDITHVILRDGFDEQVRDGARLLIEQHPNYPSIVSPSWVIKSWDKGDLEDPELFAPKYVKKAPKVMTKQKTTKKSGTSSLFRGSLFAFLRIAPPDDVVDFDRDELEGMSASNGGQLLTAEHVAALRSDSARGAQRRQCYVVCWGSFDKSNLSIHSLVSQLKREDIADVVLVSPVWLKTCASESKVIPVARCPEMFSPDSRPLRKIDLVGPGKKLEGEKSSICITVTGYAGVRRKALRFLIEAMGAYYDESLRPTTTHLICHEPSGPKYEKAIEWKIHVVSIEWLYHVAEFGYQGAKKGTSKESGCELTFQSSVPKI